MARARGFGIGAKRSRPGHARRATAYGAAFALVLLGVACSGSDGGSPTAPAPVTVTETFTGATTTSATGGCSADGHFFQVATGGNVQVTLVSSGDAAGLRAQVCADAIDNSDCTINLASIAVGGSLSGVRRGGQNQNLSFRRLGCTSGGPVVPGTVTYTATATYLRP